jgi:hypothetical protein
MKTLTVLSFIIYIYSVYVLIRTFVDDDYDGPPAQELFCTYATIYTFLIIIILIIIYLP